MSELNFRDDPEAAAEIMRGLCPSKAKQRVLFSQLLHSIAITEQFAPESWAVTLFNNGFRLNVGPVEVFTFFDGEVRFFMLGNLPSEAQKYGQFHSCNFRSMPQPQHCFLGSLAEFQKVSLSLQQAHFEYLRNAAVTSTGKPRRSSYARYHSPGLYTYAQRVAGETHVGV